MISNKHELLETSFHDQIKVISKDISYLLFINSKDFVIITPDQKTFSSSPCFRVGEHCEIEVLPQESPESPEEFRDIKYVPLKDDFLFSKIFQVLFVNFELNTEQLYVLKTNSMEKIFIAQPKDCSP